jgi:hypothetical protein
VRLALALQLVEQLQDLRLHGHVERRHGLVEHQHFGIEHQGPRDGHPLALAAGQRARAAAMQGFRQPDPAQQTGDLGGTLVAGRGWNS